MTEKSEPRVTIDQAPIVVQPQWAPVPISTDDFNYYYERGHISDDGDVASTNLLKKASTKSNGKHHIDQDHPSVIEEEASDYSEDDEEYTDYDEDDEEIHNGVGDFFTHPCKAAEQAAEQAEEFVKKVWEAGWRVVHHNSLPNWLRDNDYLHKGHRLPTNSFRACFKSIFRVHTETGNIWTHLLGMMAFLGISLYFLTRPTIEVQWQEKAVFSAFFVGAIICLGFSWVFHTVFCHSQRVGKIFNKLDYCGIAFLTMGSFVPWLYYSFYCRLFVKVLYMVLTFSLGTACIIVSLWDKFSQPTFRPVRAATFVAFGLSGVIPAMHFVITDGFWHAVHDASLGWLALMAVLYIAGAVIYAVRIPERFFPGKFDIWFQSHQIFHVCVIAAAFVHYHGITEIASYRLTLGNCFTKNIM